jgi:hypothetical protein
MTPLQIVAAALAGKAVDPSILLRPITPAASMTIGEYIRQVAERPAVADPPDDGQPRR